ncbi:AhpC-TSA-domain-containing protein [Acephala macrosclerotiorum]|nr:AhpC-TSA-domain-containing protein [Acephala macrosclerotiorum]
MSLASELNAVYTNFHRDAPSSISAPIKKSTSDFVASFDQSAAIKVGDKLPSFRLSDAHGKQVDSADLILTGPLLITFYRGNWCPYCNLALRALQKHLDDFKAKGVTLAAVTPELPDTSLSTTEKNELKFTVLSDVGNKFAKELGILFAQPDELRTPFETVGVNLKERNGDDSFVVPIPATLLVDKSGVVRNTFIDPDYTHRLEPETALGWIDALNN